MSYCFNPHCSQPNNDRLDICHSCGASLLLQQRYRGVRLLNKSQLALTLEVCDLEDLQLPKGKENPAHKVLKILLTHYPKAVELFQQEAQILGQVDHQGIPTLATDGYFTLQPQWNKYPVHCLVINKVAGQNLEQWLEGHQPISQKQAINWLKQLINILAQLHQQQYFHRDIKPSNIILQPNGRLTLIDFGAARKVTDTYLGKVGVSQGVTSIGTPGYIAPEQIDGAALPQSDFFSLGRTLVHLLTGKHPQELVKNIDTGAILWRDLAPQVSVSFADLLDLMVNPSPGKRPINIEAINRALIKVERFPHQPLINPKFSSKSSLLIGIIILSLSTIGLFSLRASFQLKTANNKTADLPLCKNITCVNRDPIDNKCDRDSQTITSTIANYQLGQDLKAYRIEVRHSPSCEAVWARTEAPHRSSHYIEDIDGNIYGQANVVKDGWEEHYADMAPGKDIQIRACAKPPGGEKSCTNFVQL